jgi:uncharacterized membrane protein YgcG
MMRRLILSSLVLLFVLPGLVLGVTLTARVTDDTGKLAGREAEIEQAAKESGIDVRVLFLHRSSDDPGGFATTVAHENGLGPGQALIMVSIEDRKDGLWAGDEAITPSELTTVRTHDLEPKLKQGDFAGGVVAAIRGIRAARDTVEPPPPPPVDWGGIVGFLGIWFLRAILVIVGIVALAWAWGVVKAARAKRRQEALDRAAAAERKAAAASAIVKADTRLVAAHEGVDFVDAEFGTDVAKAYVEQLEKADALMSAITKAHTTGAYDTVMGGVTKLEALLAAVDEAVVELRQVRDKAEQHVADVERLAKITRGRVEAAQVDIAAIREFGRSRLADAEADVANALKLADDAIAEAAGARALLGTGARAKAGFATQAIQAKLDEASKHLNEVEAVRADLKDAQRSCESQVKRAEAMLAKAEAAATETKVNVRAGVAAARKVLERARKGIASDVPDFLAIADLLDEVYRAGAGAYNEVMQVERDRQRRLEEARAQVRAAELQVEEASRYIGSRSHVGAAARRKAQEAEEKLARARQIDDPFEAARQAQMATMIAAGAYQQGRNDVQRHEDSESGGGYGGSSSSSSSGGGYDSGSSSGSSYDSSSGGSFGGGGSSSGGGW